MKLLRIFSTIFLLSAAIKSLAQNSTWHSSAQISPPINKTYIIETELPYEQIQQHWKVLNVRNSRQYIVSSLPKKEYKNIIFSWSEWQPEQYIKATFEFKDNQEEIYKSIIIWSPLATQQMINDILSKNNIPPIEADNTYKGINVGTIKLTKDQILSLSKNQYITSIEPIFNDEPLNYGARVLTNTSIVKSNSILGGENLSGKDVVIGIGDDGDNHHIDISHRIIRQFSPINSTGHAIHVAVTATGNGIINESTEGFAHQASVISHYFNAILAYSEELYNDFNMTITNNSYAQRIGDCNYAGVYNATSQAVDMMMTENPYILHVFAAGNDGLKTCSPHPTGYGTVVGFYQSSKNALVVGNIGKNYQFLYNGSSKGPLRDGRLKPEIGANGVAVFSGWTNNSYVNNNGTSMASPNVAGAAGLLTEKYKQLHSNAQPESALLKILLMNGTKDVHHEGPDYFYGFGIMDIAQSIKMLSENQYNSNSINTGETQIHTISIPENVAKAKFMIYWHDLPASPTPDDPSISKLINDIDIKVISPTGSHHLPWTLDPNNPTSPATTGIDRINNVEQITLNFPSAGTYQIEVKGHHILDAAQKYFVAWDFEYNELKLSSPIGDEHFAENDSLRIQYSYPNTTQTFNIELSTNNGTTWTTIATALPSHVRHFNYLLPSGINSDNCRIKVTVNGAGHTILSQPFTISQKPIIELEVDNLQCPGSISVFWNAIPNATNYIMYLHENGIMKNIDTIPASVLKYNFSGLRTDQQYEVSVAPLFNSRRGIRANATWRTPNTGSCSGTAHPDYDVALVDFYQLQNGRKYTSIELPGNKIISVIVQNRGKNTISTIPLTLKLNDESITTQSFTVSLPPGALDTLYFNTHPLNLNDVAHYSIQVYKTTSTYVDNIVINDTISTTIKQIQNEPIDLSDGFVEDFAFTSKTFYHKPYIGLEGADRWDYSKTNGWGRLTSFVNSAVSINDSHALSMDIKTNALTTPDSASTNQAFVTFNLSDYNILENEIRFDLKYRFAGQPKYFNSNAIFVRGSDTDDWLFASYFDTTYAGVVKTLNEISLNDILSANGQTFSQNTQIKIEQKDTSLIAGVDFGNGLTIDNFRLYAITDDVSIERITSPTASNCSLGDFNITIDAKNNVFYTLYNIPVYYQVNGGEIKSSIIDSITSKTVISFTFPIEENFEEYAIYEIKAWVAYPSDESRNNDTFTIHSSFTPIISEFPYLETFDSVSENFIFTHSLSAWIKDSTTSSPIKQAANGKYFISTAEIKESSTQRSSYIYLPCLDISNLDNPALSFSNALYYSSNDSSNPTKAYVEYSIDGLIWSKLGAHDSIANWYNNDQNVWANETFNWISSSTILPDVDLIKIRFVFESYPENRFDKWLIDDIHIYDLKNNIPTSNAQMSITHSAGTDTFSNSSHEILGWLSSNDNIGSSTLQSFNHISPVISNSHEALPMINYAISYNSEADKTLALYIPHQAINNLSKNNDCASCYKLSSIYDAGISQYNSNDKNEWNDKLEDNISGNYLFIPKRQIVYIPYFNGYIAVFKNKIDGELWFNSGYPNDNDLSFQDITLTGYPISHQYAHLEFNSYIDTFVNKYFLERKNLVTGAYQAIAEFDPINADTAQYFFNDAAEIINKIAQYRVRYSHKDGTTRLTNDVTIDWGNTNTFGIYPNPVSDGSLYISWNLNEIADINYSIISMSGQIIYESKITDISHNIGFTIIPLNDIGIAPGNYIIRINSGDQKENFKLIYLQ